MSINTNLNTTITLDTTEVQTSPSTEVTLPGNSCVEIAPLNEITATRKEYSIVGDAFYAGINSNVAPTWLVNLVNSVVSNAVNNGLTDYDLLVQDVRNAIDSIDVAKNTYVEQINFTSLVDGIIGTHLQTLNAEHDGKFATIINLETVRVDSESALALRATDLQAEFSTTINSRITTVEEAYADADGALASSITALTTAFTDQETSLSGTASSVSGLQTYVGLAGNNTPNGTGILSRVSLLESQTDGVIEYTTNTYSVMGGIQDPNTDTSDDYLVTDALPYVLWTNMSGTGAPVATTRPYTDYTLETSATANANVQEHTLYVRDDSTNVDTDTYYKFLSNTWSVITEAVYITDKERIRDSHIADVYIQFSENTSGARIFLNSYKFIKAAVDVTDPYVTDGEGYTWAVITDTDAQNAYTLALEAKDLVDGKRRVFVNLGSTTTPHTPYDIGDLWLIDTVRTIDGQLASVGDIFRAVETKGSSATYEQNDWVSASSFVAAVNAEAALLETWKTDVYSAFVTSIGNQVDQKAESFYQESTPTGRITGTNASLAVFIGDLWKTPSNNKEYIYQLVSGTYQWVETDVPDSVYDTIDGKKAIYVGNTAPAGTTLNPIQLNDMWITGESPVGGFDSGTIYVATSLDPVIWSIPVKYTDDSTVTILSNGLSTGTVAINLSLATVDGSNSIIDYVSNQLDLEVVVYSGTDVNTQTGMKIDDIYIEKAVNSDGAVDVDVINTYKYDGTNWVEIGSNSNLTALADLADGKRTIYSNVSNDVPSGVANDLWIPTSGTDDTTYIPGEVYQYNSGWNLATKYTENLDAFIDTVNNTLVPSIVGQIDDKITYYFQLSTADDPDVWSTSDDAKHSGDILHYTDTNESFYFDDSVGTWVAIRDKDALQAIADAATAQGAADGKVSHYFAWGGVNAPVDYEVVLRPIEYSKNEYGEYLDSGGVVTTVPADYVVVQAEESETVLADDFIYWFDASTLYRKETNWADRVAVPTNSGNGSYIAEGDILSVFDPVSNDMTVYVFNSLDSWQTTGPTGIISKSKFFVDLKNSVSGPNGLAKAVSNLQITSSAYTDAQTTEVENKFSYNSQLFLGDKFYNSGFGLNSTGITQVTDGETAETAYDSEFWVNAERFVIYSPTHEVSASFVVTASGIKLSLENTEATRNVAAGTHSSSESYTLGDTVTYEGSSYTATQNVPANTTIVGRDGDDVAYWQLLAAGSAGSYVDFLFIRSVLPPEIPGGSDTWYSDVVSATGSGDLWSVKKTITQETTVYSDKRIIESELVKELRIYSYSTLSSVVANDIDSPTSSTYDFSTSTLTINDVNWNKSIPSVLTNNHSIWVYVGLVEGNITETAKPVTWSITPSVYSQRVDGGNGGTGDQGIQGNRGTAVLTYSALISHALPSNVPESSLNSYWASKASAGYLQKVVGDTLVVTNTTAITGWTHIYEYTSTGWDASNTFVVSGNQVVEGTISSEALVTGIIIGEDAFFEGELSAASGTFIGDVTGANGTFGGQLSANSAVINTSEVATNSAPFIVKHRNGYQSNERIDRSIVTPELYSPSYSVGFYNYRLSHTVMDVEFEIFSVLDSGKQSRGNTNVKVAYDGGAFTEIATVIHVSSNHTGTLPIFVSYTTKSEPWDRVQFQVSVFGSPGENYADEFRSLGLFYTMEVLNHAESGNTSESVRTFDNDATPPSFPGIGCFIAGSLITMSDGTVKVIEDIIVGENLLGYKGSCNKVLQLWQHATHERIIFSINNGLLETTSAHPILTTEGWKALDPEKSIRQHPGMAITLLSNGDTLVKMCVTGEILEEVVTSISSTLCNVPVYNFDVSGNSTYIVNDVVVHNK